jgi:hypothetical protein
MADFKTKVITLAGMATMFAGMAFGQAALSPNGVVTTGAVFIRAEGATELLPATTLTINNPSGSATQVTFTVYLAPSLPITSQVVSKNSEATAVGSSGNVTGIVNGSTVVFSNVSILPAPASTTITIEGIRVNASSLATGSGIPQGVSEQVFLQGASGVVTPGATSPTIVAYATNGLVNSGTNAVSVPSGSIVNGTVCNGISGNGFTINLSEGFVGAFKTLAGEMGVDNATTGTGLSITFANVPPNTAIYLPLTVSAGASPAGTLTLVVSPTSSATGSNVVAPTSATGVPTTEGAVAVSNGTATAYYEVTASNPSSIDSYSIPVYEVTAAGALAGPASAITATVSLAPSVAAGTAPTNYPSFVGATSQQMVNGNSFTACSTVLLFPFVTNQSGFETGIAIANTSSDLLGLKKGAAVDSVTGQSGTCYLTFFGSSSPAAYTSPSVAAGTDWTATLTSVTGGTPNTFGGYMIATCNFLYAHGFSYISYNIGQSSGMAMGYLALEVAPRSNTSASTNYPETLGN